MRELRLLLKLQRINALRLNEWRHTRDKKQKRRLGGMLLAYAVMSVFGVGYSGLYAWLFYASGQHALLPGAMVTAASVVSLLATMAKVPGGLLEYREGELLFSLPVKPRSVLLARLLDLYIASLATALLVLGPAWVFWLMGAGFSWGALGRIALITLAAPLLPSGIGIALGALFSLASTRLKHKNLLLMLLSLLAMAFFFVWVYTAPAGIDSQQQMLAAASRSGVALAAAWPPAGWAAQAAAGDGSRLALFLGTGLLAALLVYAALAPRYQELLQRLGRVHQAAGRRGTDGPRSPLMALVRKERGRLMASPLYLMNTAMMAWLMPVVLVILQLMKPEFLGQLNSMPQLASLVEPFLPLAAAGFVGMSATTTVSLSMEGKNAWLMATAPVPPRTVCLSKLLLSLFNAWPASLLASALLVAALRPAWPAAAATFLLPLSVALFAGVLGLVADRRHARYDWDREQQIVKNSVQTLLAVGGFFTLMLALAAALWFSGPWAPWAAMGLSALLAALSVLVFYRLGRRPIFLIS